MTVQGKLKRENNKSKTQDWTDGSYKGDWICKTALSESLKVAIHI